MTNMAVTVVSLNITPASTSLYYEGQEEIHIKKTTTTTTTTITNKQTNKNVISFAFVTIIHDIESKYNRNQRKRLGNT